MLNLKFILAWALAASLAPALQAEGDPVSGMALLRMRESRAGLGLDALADFVVKEELRDAQGWVHVRLQQTYRGLPVWGGQAIFHLDPAGHPAPLTDALVRNIQIDSRPNLGVSEALAVAQDRVAPRGTYSGKPQADLVIWPERAAEGTEGNALDPRNQPTVLQHRLAYHVHMELENGSAETRHEDLLVDANTGAMINAWSSLFTARKARPAGTGTPARAVGHSLYSGKVELSTLSTGDGYELMDPTRGGFSTRNLAGAFGGAGQIFVNAGLQWGDGENYDPGRGTASANSQTAAVDAHYGLQVTWDFYRNILGRDGVDGNGRGPTNLVHYGAGYDNAFWSDSCFCMTYGDGLMSRNLTSLDIVGHEVSHGLCSATAGLEYQGESGGLNEASSDIFGILIRQYARKAGGAGQVIPDAGMDWTVGGEVMEEPYRYMDKPSRDGHSPDEWSPGLRTMDVHFSSGPMNRAFFFLSQGASADPSSPVHSRRLPSGMAGIGNDKALRIWWRTLSTQLTPSSGYRQARAGALRSARELYGAGGPEERAVALAFKAINVGRSSR